MTLEPAGGQFGTGPTFGAGSMVLLSASALDGSLVGPGQTKRPQHVDPQATSMAWHKHEHLVLMDKSKPKCKFSLCLRLRLMTYHKQTMQHGSVLLMSHLCPVS